MSIEMNTDLAAPTARRLPLNTLGIAFGLSGLAGTWTVAADGLGAPRLIAEVLWVVAAAALVVTLARYAHRVDHFGEVTADLRDPVLGPFAALAPVALSLQGAHLATFAPDAGAVVVALTAVLTTAYGVWFVAQLLTVPRPPAALHGGYLLPTVAASLVTAQTLASIGAGTLARGFLATGLLFWGLVGTLLLARFVTGPELPSPLLPTLAVFSAPPAVAGNAWWVIGGGGPDALHAGLAAAMVALLLPHLALLPRYRRLTFTTGFWAFTFTAAASATYGVRLLGRTPGGWSGAASWLLVVGTTVLIGAIALRTLAPVLGRLRHAHRVGGPGVAVALADPAVDVATAASRQ